MGNQRKEAYLGGELEYGVGMVVVLVHGGVNWPQKGRTDGVNASIMSLVFNMASSWK